MAPPAWMEARSFPLEAPGLPSAVPPCRVVVVLAPSCPYVIVGCRHPQGQTAPVGPFRSASRGRISFADRSADRGPRIRWSASQIDGPQERSKSQEALPVTRLPVLLSVRTASGRGRTRSPPWGLGPSPCQVRFWRVGRYWTRWSPDCGDWASTSERTVSDLLRLPLVTELA